MHALLALIWIGGTLAFVFALWCACAARLIAFVLVRVFR
jgi:uncharacterized membrane protein